MKPEAPLLRRFFLPAEEQLCLPMYLPATGVLCFAACENRHIVCINIKKERKKANENNTAKRKSNRVHRKR